MEKDILDISQETLDNLTIEELADLKIRVDDLSEKLQNIIATCDEAINSLIKRRNSNGFSKN